MPYHFFLIIFLYMELISDVKALIPLLPILDIADKNLEFWEKDGQFLVGIKEKSVSIDPFQNDVIPPEPQMLPKDIDSWRSLGKNCDGRLIKKFSIDKIPYEVHLKEVPITTSLEFGSLSETAGFFEIRLYRDGLFMAQNSIPRPIEPCNIILLDIDGFEGQEILIVWNYLTDIKGMIAYSIPDMVK